MSGEAIIDASLFMAMNSIDEATRRRGKAFFVARLGTGAVMPLEQVGACDDLVWGYRRAEQDAYYPFMDVLHTEMKIDRIGYTEDDLKRALESPELAGLSLRNRLTAAVVLNRGGTLYTVDPELTARDDLPLGELPDVESAFPQPLEGLYKQSLVLRVGGGA
ncbi:DUF6190 family protein [Saccharothrix sp.]|uniref:DUF6190 family protein n=1 Tax=Saccharothrix sp. TaxID=1873460 RepID=UPI002810A1C4|nr:DUF6190 family protein [Saccharothrix sp.]